MAIILSKATKTGQTMTVATTDGSELTVSVGDQVVYQGKMSPCRLPQAPAGMPEITWHIGGKVGITAAEAATVASGQAMARNEWSKTHPVERPVLTLEQQRRAIVDRLNGAIEDAERAYWRENAKGVGDSGWGARQPYDDEAKAARAELAAFDRDYPWIKAEIERKRAEDAQRFAETN